MGEPAPGISSGAPACANCGAPVPERYCARCGQERKTLRVAFHRLAGEAIGEAFSLDSNIARTLGALVFVPGEATRRYLAGKRASQTSPVKLYLLLSFIYFFASALGPSRIIEVGPGDAPAGSAANAPARDGALVVVDGSGDLENLRAMGGMGARLADRLAEMERLPPEEVRRRVQARVLEHAPTAMFFMLPLLALLLRLFYLRAGFYFAEHVVFALHAHAVAFLFLTPAAISGSARALNVGWVAAGLHTLVAMKRVYRRSWVGTLARAAAVGGLYAIALGLALLAAVILAVVGA